MIETQKMVPLVARCIDCGTTFSASVRSSDYDLYTFEGYSVQDAFPYLTAGQRELFFMSRMCEDCFDSIFFEED